MAITGDVLTAKRELSKRLLRAPSLRSVPSAAPFMLSVSSAVDSAPYNLHAVGAGRKVVSGSTVTTPCVRLYVARKLPLSLLPSSAILPKEIDGIPTDVIESAPAFVLEVPDCSVQRQACQRPIVGGISAALHTITAGTLSCLCRSTREKDDAAAVYALSNNHVFADVDTASVGDHLYQPGPLDGGTQNDHFADFVRAVPIHLGGTEPNRVDAAIGRLLPDTPFDPIVCSIGRITGTEPAEEDMPVRKHGRTTGYTEGRVTDESYDPIVGMDHSDPSVRALFEDQLRIERVAPYPAIGLGGDSGSLVVHKDRPHAVGLYFAGPSAGDYGVANPIADVLQGLEIAIL